jgi:hypothetical protein
MLGFKCFVCSLFLWLSFISPQQFDGVTLIADSQAEIISSSNEADHQTIIFDKHFETNQANWSLKTFKLPYVKSVDKVEQPKAKTYDYKLLYLEIGNSIPLQLTSRTIIYPFHFFT